MLINRCRSEPLVVEVLLPGTHISGHEGREAIMPSGAHEKLVEPTQVQQRFLAPRVPGGSLTLPAPDSVEARLRDYLTGRSGHWMSTSSSFLKRIGSDQAVLARDRA